MRHIRRSAVAALATLGLVGGGLSLVGVAGSPAGALGNPAPATPGTATKTPIKHLVVIFDENVSFDHYFGTYPFATNPPGEPAFHAKPDTPSVNGLANSIAKTKATGPLLTQNGNLSNPLRLDRSDAMTCDQDHGYSAEQAAADHGAEDLYAQETGNGLTLSDCLTQENAGLTNKSPIPPGADSNYAVMDYYDGNTVTALWNYAQHFSMSDNMYGTTYGPSTPGALNVSAAQTYGAICGPTSATINAPACAAPSGYSSSNVVASDLTTGTTGVDQQPPAGPGTTYSDADPTYDICSYLPKSDGGDGNAPASTIAMGGNNIGEQLTKSGVTWGWFEGGFDDGYVPGHGTAPTTAQICSGQHKNVGGASVVDYIPHHEPFEYYASTANPMHKPPSSVAAIGRTDQANHQYDLADFWAAANTGNLPAVSYLKAPAYQDGHAGYSDPLDEQNWLVGTINQLERLPSWSSTAVVVTMDDSDGWYDHVLAPIVTGSQTSLDNLTAANSCGSSKLVPTNSASGPEQGKCGLGPRLPFLVVSPYSRPNSVSSTLIDQSSVVRFIEHNWGLPAMGNGAADGNAGSLSSFFDWSGPSDPPLYLDAASGEPVGGSGVGGNG